MSRRIAAFTVLALALAACDPAVSPTPIRPGSTPAATASSGATTAPQPPSAAPGSTAAAGPAEPGVIKGLVTDAQGDPLSGAVLRVFGYTGDVVRQHDEDIVTGADGTYRTEVPDGLYDVRGQARLQWQGQEYLLDLTPVDGACDEAESSFGIVENFVLQLSGLKACGDVIDPNNDGSYIGGSVGLLSALGTTYPADAEVRFTLTPDGPLADGSTGETLAMTRTVGGLTTTMGPLDEIGTLYDIPLGRYTMTADVVTANGATEPLNLFSQTTTVPTRSLTLTFPAAQFFPYGIQEETVTVTTEGLG